MPRELIIQMYDTNEPVKPPDNARVIVQYLHGFSEGWYINKKFINANFHGEIPNVSAWGLWPTYYIDTTVVHSL